MLGKPAGIEAPLPSTITGDALRHLWPSSIAVSTGVFGNSAPRIIRSWICLIRLPEKLVEQNLYSIVLTLSSQYNDFMPVGPG
jgi:hypothetical protein